MPYRDDKAARDVRIRQAEERVATLEAKLPAALRALLPRKLRGRLEERAAFAAAADADAREAALMAYARTLARAAARAPDLDKELNRLPYRVPVRQTLRWRGRLPDIYDDMVAELRDALHREIDAVDPEAIVHDRSTDYFLARPDGYVVDASFRCGGAPIRLHVAAQTRDAGFLSERGLDARVGMFAHVRLSVPAFALYSLPPHDQSHPFDEAFARHGLPPLAREAQALLLELRSTTSELMLEVDAGCARIEWSLAGRALGWTAASTMRLAAKVLATLRRIPPSRR